MRFDKSSFNFLVEKDLITIEASKISANSAIELEEYVQKMRQSNIVLDNKVQIKLVLL